MKKNSAPDDLGSFLGFLRFLGLIEQIYKPRPQAVGLASADLAFVHDLEDVFDDADAFRRPPRLEQPLCDSLPAPEQLIGRFAPVLRLEDFRQLPQELFSLLVLCQIAQCQEIMHQQ